MKKNFLLSVIIITHNNYSLKNGCIELVLLSISKQKFKDYEIIIIDNQSKIGDYQKLAAFIDRIPRATLYALQSNNISHARNFGISLATGECIVFIDDDTILIEDDTFELVAEGSSQRPYGYGAERLWSLPHWLDYTAIQLAVRSKELPSIPVQIPNPQIRNKTNLRCLNKTFLGNFGFVSKTAILEAGGWDETFVGYGCEDDDLACRLYILLGVPLRLDSISVLHIWHEIKETNLEELKENKLILKRKYQQMHIKEFHIGRLLYEENTEIIEYLS